MRGWLFHSFMPAAGLGQNTPPLALRSRACSSTTKSLLGGLPDMSVHFGEPVGVLGIAAVHDIEEGALDFFGERTARTGADLDPVEFADGRHFGRGAGEERLVGDVDLVARDSLLHDLSPRSLQMWNTV